MKRIESLLKLAGMTFEFENLKSLFHKRQVSFLVVVLPDPFRDIGVWRNSTVTH